ncbi:MAG: M20/M25/M40 family metallo-hydrolase [Gemmatimonadales bacterium]
MRLITSLLFICLAAPNARAQPSFDSHAPAAERLIAAALRDSTAWNRLAKLTDTFGARPSGSASLERAIDWIVAEMRKDGFDNVHTEPVMVTHWVRGSESATMERPRRVQLHVLGLGKSVGTPPGGIVAPVLVVRDFAELRSKAAQAKGKIVVYDFPFDTTVHPFVAYGQAVQYRAYGADSAVQFGALATLSRSATPLSLQTPHTGGLSYADTIRKVPQIPGASISPEDAQMLHRLQQRGETPVVRLTMGAKTLPLAPSRNVIAEIRGSEHPDEIIVLGGHIDSWDVGTGAMDDGGGCVAAWEALRLIKQSGVRPKRTIRVVLWTNEELGLSGALAYRDAHRAQLDKHIVAMESDNGVFKPRGILFSGSADGLPMMRQLAHLLKNAGADSVTASGPEADVWPLNTLGVPTVAIDTDPTRYFWYHHTEADTIDKLDPRDVSLCAAIMAAVANTVANMEGRIPRAPVASGN